MADNKRIPVGKRRYAITLTVEHVNRFRKLSEHLGMPPSTLSRALDEFLDGLTKSMEEFRERHASSGKLTLGDLFEVVGQQLNEKEETTHDEKQKRNPQSD